MQYSDYTLFSRILHRFALSSTILKETAFELDCFWAGKEQKHTENEHIFITGLARAGTTIFLKILYHTNHFASLCYRDMPFVTAPFIWERLSHGLRKKGKSKLRAHNDRIKIDFDSPEAFEEVFWLTFTGRDYIGNEYLTPYDIEEDMICKFRLYIENVLKKNRKSRYLSKNNNNILRLPSLSRAFPNSHIIILFRNPTDHATSLLRQHLKFTELQKTDKFVLQYMNWLGHFEFGQNCKRTFFNENRPSFSYHDPATFEYWLRIWIDTYKYVLSVKNKKYILLDYDDLTVRPEHVLHKIASRLNIEKNDLLADVNQIAPSVHYETKTDFYDDFKEAKSIHTDLRKRYSLLFDDQ